MIRTSRVAMKILSRNCESCSLRSFNIRSVASKRLFIEASSAFRDIFSFLSVEEGGSGPDGIKKNDPDNSSPWRERKDQTNCFPVEPGRKKKITFFK